MFLISMNTTFLVCEELPTTVVGDVMVGALACDLRGRGFISRPFHCQEVTTSGKLLTHVPLSSSSIILYQSRGSDVLRVGS